MKDPSPWGSKLGPSIPRVTSIVCPAVVVQITGHKTRDFKQHSVFSLDFGVCKLSLCHTFFDILQFFLLTTESQASGKTGRFGAGSVMMGRSSSCEKPSENCSGGPCRNRPLVPFQTKRLFAFLFLCLVLNDSGLWCHKIIRMLKNAVLIQSLMFFLRSNSKNSHHKKSKCSWQSCFGTWCLSLLAATINEASELINALVLQVCLRLNSAQLKTPWPSPTPKKPFSRGAISGQTACATRSSDKQRTHSCWGSFATFINQANICWEIFKCQMSYVFMTTWTIGTPWMPDKNVRIPILHVKHFPLKHQLDRFPWTLPAPEVAHLVDPMQCSLGSWHLSGNLLSARLGITKNICIYIISCLPYNYVISYDFICYLEVVRIWSFYNFNLQVQAFLLGIFRFCLSTSG